MLNAVKLALRVTTSAFDDQLNQLINAAKKDLSIAGVPDADDSDPLIQTAIISYCRLNFGAPDDYERLKRSYDEQKMQLGMATGYTEWSE